MMVSISSCAAVLQCLFPTATHQTMVFFFDIRYSSGYTYKTSTDVPFDVPIHILEKNGNFNFGNAPADFVPARDSPDENTYECYEISTASKSIGIFNFDEDISDFVPARDSPDDGAFNFGFDISRAFALKCGKVSHTCFLSLFLYIFCFCAPFYGHITKHGKVRKQF
jgi:hypothetical protein